MESTADTPNPYALGHSPTKKVKIEAADFKFKPHVFYVAHILGGLYEFIWCDHGKNPGDEGFVPNAVNVVKKKIIVSPGGVELTNKVFQGLQIQYVFYRRAPNGSIKTNVSEAKNGIHYKQHVFVRTNKVEESGGKRFGTPSEQTLIQLKRENERLNMVMDEKKQVKITNTYAIGKDGPLIPKNPDGSLVSADHFLLDDDVVTLMEDNCLLLKDEGENFFKNYPDIAAVYFNPERPTYPASVKKYGFIDKAIAPASAEISEIDPKDIDKFRAA